MCQRNPMHSASISTINETEKHMIQNFKYFWLIVNQKLAWNSVLWCINYRHSRYKFGIKVTRH